MTLVVVDTNHGSFTISLDAEKAPKTVENLLGYVDAKHYDGTIFHRVIAGFMAQGGGYDTSMEKRPVRAGAERSAQRPRERARNGGHGAHLGPALGLVSILRQCPGHLRP
jgi:peptidyl-prolyl cis-trans isomerase B (cyclophilin B)